MMGEEQRWAGSLWSVGALSVLWHGRRVRRGGAWFVCPLAPMTGDMRKSRTLRFPYLS